MHSVSHTHSSLNGTLVFLASAADATGLSEFYTGSLILTESTVVFIF